MGDRTHTPSAIPNFAGGRYIAELNRSKSRPQRPAWEVDFLKLSAEVHVLVANGNSLSADPTVGESVADWHDGYSEALRPMCEDMGVQPDDFEAVVASRFRAAVGRAKQIVGQASRAAALSTQVPQLAENSHSAAQPTLTRDGSQALLEQAAKAVDLAEVSESDATEAVDEKPSESADEKPSAAQEKRRGAGGEAGRGNKRRCEAPSVSAAQPTLTSDAIQAPLEEAELVSDAATLESADDMPSAAPGGPARGGRGRGGGRVRSGGRGRDCARGRKRRGVDSDRGMLSGRA